MAPVVAHKPDRPHRRQPWRRGTIRERTDWMRSPNGYWLGYRTIKAELTLDGRSYRRSWSVDKWGLRKARRLARITLELWRARVDRGQVPYRKAPRGPR